MTPARRGGDGRTRPGAARALVEAARPRTLPVGLSPVVVGTAAAAGPVAWRAAAAAVVALGLQVAVNYANDVADAVRGVDTAERVGPRRAVASGLVGARAMTLAAVVAALVAAAAGTALAAAVGWHLLAVGAVCVLAAAGYSAGPRPYASLGLGEVMVLGFFGLVATTGTAYVHDVAITPAALAAAAPMGLLAAAVLAVNNLRDLRTDAEAGKRTLAVRLGERGARRLVAGLLAGGVASVALVAWAAGSPWPLLGLLAAPAAAPPARAALTAPLGPELVPALAWTAAAQLGCAAALAVGLVLAG